MRGIVKIGEANVEMAANAATPYIYKQVFHEDFLREVQKDDPQPDLLVKMGFIMQKQAAVSSPQELMKLNEGEFLDWLGQFEPMEPILATKDIADFYFSQTKESSVPKEEAG